MMMMMMKMNSIAVTVKSALSNCKPNGAPSVALFHSTPFLDRKRRTHPDPRFNNYSKRSRKQHMKESLLRNVSAYAEELFQSWQSGFDPGDSPNQGTSWFKKPYGPSGSRRRWTSNQGGPLPGGIRGFQFCEDDDMETIFRSAFGGNRHSYWCFTSEGNPWDSSDFRTSQKQRFRFEDRYENNYRTTWNWKSRMDNEYDSSSESDSCQLDLVSHRLALGLSTTGSLKLEEVKKAYRACALKWHPDRHQGSSKVEAEEKFKLCSAAYQSLCDELAVA